MNSVEKEGLKHLKNIEDDIEEIKERTPTPRRSFLQGLLWGAGTVLGSLLALAIIGWILALSGFIPGFRDMADYLQTIVSQIRR